MKDKQRNGREYGIGWRWEKKTYERQTEKWKRILYRLKMRVENLWTAVKATRGLIVKKKNATQKDKQRSYRQYCIKWTQE